MKRFQRKRMIKMHLLTPGTIAAACFLLSLATGTWLYRLGRPVNVVVVTIHKLISLATVIFTGLVIYLQYKAAAIMAPVRWAAIGITGLLFISLFASGALLSSTKPANPIASIIHKVAPVLSVIFSMLTFLILLFSD